MTQGACRLRTIGSLPLIGFGGRSMNNSLTVLRSIIFPRREICEKTELYFRTGYGSVDYCDELQKLNISGTASFDTYFNSLPLDRLNKYCKLSSLCLRLKVCGLFVMRIYGVKQTDGSIREELIAEKNIGSADITAEYITDLTDVIGSSFSHVYFTLTSEKGVLYGGEFLAGNDDLNRVSIAAVICTFRREKFLLHNHREISSYLEKSTVFSENSIHIYIVDNGRTLDKAAVENRFASLIPNDNTGGSGGFTRGYREAVNSGRGYTHILFMDDDIVLDCEMLLRVYSLLRLRRPEYAGLSVGGTMLMLSDRVTCHEAGALWNGKYLCSIGNGDDMTLRENVFLPAAVPGTVKKEYIRPDYNAWWFYCFPASWQKEHGYPLQFFIKEDDIEYSLRCAEEIAVPEGIAVWHDDFEGKYDGFQEYYIKRNELILTSVNDQKPYALFQVRKLILSVMKQTVFQRYFLADIIFRAYDDYLKGWKHFRDTDTAALNKELMDSCRPLLSDDELFSQEGVRFDREKYDTAVSEPENLKKQALSMNGYLIPAAFYRRDKDGYSMADLAGCRIVNFYKHRRVLHYDTAKHKGFVTVQKRSQLWKNIFRLIYKSVRFLIMYPSVRRGYKKHLDELTR